MDQSFPEPEETALIAGNQALPLTRSCDEPTLDRSAEPEKAMSSLNLGDPLLDSSGQNQSSRECHGAAAQGRIPTGYGQRSATLRQEKKRLPILLLLALRQGRLHRPGMPHMETPARLQIMALPGGRRKVKVFTANSAPQAMRVMSLPGSQRLTAVIAHDGEIAFPEHEELASRVASYVRAGGTLILGPHFCCTTMPTLADKFFEQVCHLPWWIYPAQQSNVYYFSALVHSDRSGARRAVFGRGKAGVTNTSAPRDVDLDNTLADPVVEEPPHVAFGESPPLPPRQSDAGDAIAQSRAYEPLRLSSILLTVWPTLIDAIHTRQVLVYLKILRRGTYHWVFADSCTSLWTEDFYGGCDGSVIRLMIPSLRQPDPLVRCFPRPPSDLLRERVETSPGNPGSPASITPPLRGTVDGAAHGSLKRRVSGVTAASRVVSKRPRSMDAGVDDHVTTGQICTGPEEVAVSGARSRQLLASAEEDPATPLAPTRPTVMETREERMSRVHSALPSGPEDDDATRRPWSLSHALQIMERHLPVDPLVINGQPLHEEVPRDRSFFPDPHMSATSNASSAETSVDGLTALSPRPSPRASLRASYGASLGVLGERSCNEASAGERAGDVAPQSRASAAQALASALHGPTGFNRGLEHASQKAANPCPLPVEYSTEGSCTWTTAVSAASHRPPDALEFASRVPLPEDSGDSEDSDDLVSLDYRSSEYPSTEVQSDDTDSDYSWQGPPPSSDHVLPSAIRWRAHVLKGVPLRDRVYCADRTGILSGRCATGGRRKKELSVNEALELSRRDQGTVVAFTEMGKGYIGYLGGLHADADDHEKPLRMAKRLEALDLTDIDRKDAKRKGIIERRLEASERIALDAELIVTAMCNLFPPEDADGDAADGDAANGEAANGDGANGETANGDAADGDAANGKAANGDGANGDGANGEAANGDGANGDGANGETANGDAADGDAANGETADADAAAGYRSTQMAFYMEK
ncbi:MAG: hypothetical protein M1815_000342 [Lichina confinis]|nr:MAG: hypothetical protein M1815_000342 [Lichina confinis]